MHTKGLVGWGFYFAVPSLMLAQCDFSRRARRCLVSERRSISELTNCLLFLGVFFLTWSWDIAQVRHMPYRIGIAVVGHFQLSQDGTSGCLIVMPAMSES